MSDPYYDDNVLEVKWDSEAWDDAIEARADVGRSGRVLFTPRRMLVDAAAVAANEEVRNVLDRAKAKQARDVGAAKTAARLGLAIFTVPEDDELLRAVDALCDNVPGSASREHLWAPGGNRIHGDDMPQPTDDPNDIPGQGDLGAGLTIFVLDTGIAPALTWVDPADFGPGDLEVPDEDENDVRDHAAGHGTHAAGLIARTAPGARIVPRRILTSPVGLVSELDAAEAILDAGAAGANIISCSWGGTTLDDLPPLATARAIEQLPEGTLVVAAAGNSFSPQPTWPAACEGVIAVGSVGRENGGPWLRTDFSNFGTWVDCCAPGVAVASAFLTWTDGDGDPAFAGYATWSGTSMSCPQVAAAIAALATRDDITASAAADVLVFDPDRPKIGPVGTLVVPSELPPPQ